MTDVYWGVMNLQFQHDSSGASVPWQHNTVTMRNIPRVVVGILLQKYFL